MSIAEKFEVIADAVFEKGKEKECNDFWDVYLNKGNAQSYIYAFYGAKWTDANYKPTYPIVVSGNANNMFQQTGITDTLVDIDISGITSANTAGMFQYSSKIETIRKLIVTKNNSFSNCFVSCTALKNITFDGTIGKNISFADSPLTVASMKNVISHLKDYTRLDTTKINVYSLTLSSNCKTALETEGMTAEYDGTECTWTELVEHKGWVLN